MKNTSAYLFIALLASGIAMAQESDPAKTTQESATKTNSEMVNKEQATSNTDAKKESMAKGHILSSRLVDTNIENASDEEIGEITDIVLDEDGKVTGIIVSVGGFLGMGEKHVSLPWDSVDIVQGEDEDDYQITTALGKEELENTEEYKAEDW